MKQTTVTGEDEKDIDPPAKDRAPHRKTPEIAADKIRECRHDEMAEIARHLVSKGGYGIALDLRAALDREMRAGAPAAPLPPRPAVPVDRMSDGEPVPEWFPKNSPTAERPT